MKTREKARWVAVAIGMFAASYIGAVVTSSPAKKVLTLLVERLASSSAAVKKAPSSKKLALVLPFIDAQVETRLRSTLERWEQYAPCDEPPDLNSVTAYFYHPGLSSSKAADIAAFWKSAVNASCFRGGMKMLYAGLSDEVANKHPDGPCAQFYQLFEVLRGEADHFFVMEPDAVPIRRLWLSRLAKLADDDPWVVGSLARCNKDYGDIFRRRDAHINGNALYRVGDAGFDDFLDRVKDFYPAFMAPEAGVAGCATGEGYEGGHDNVMWQFLQHPVNFDYARQVRHKFRYTEVVQNMCEDEYDESSMPKDTFVVHSKAPFFSREEAKFRRLYWDYAGQWPDRNRVLELKNTYSGREEALAKELCASERYRQLVATAPREVCTELCVRDAKFRARHAKECGPATERLRWEARVPPDRAYVWSTDLHVSPIACNEPIIKALGAVVHAEIDFNNCIWYPQFCKKRLKVLQFDEWRGFSLDPCPYTIRRAFFDAYKNDEELRRVDLFVCSHPPANCELYMPFNRSILVYATTRLEFGRHDDRIDWRRPSLDEQSPRRWSEWIANLKRIARLEGNFVAANNLFDVHYIKYHAGIDATYLPSWCEQPGIKYAPVAGKPFLLGPYRDNLVEAKPYQHPILQSLKSALERAVLRGQHLPCASTADCFVRIRDLYPNYKWSDITQHPAMVFIPYQVSTMFFFEIYRTNTPVFVPSLDLLISWVRKHGILWERVYGTPERQPHAAWAAEPDSPNSDVEGLSYWLSHCDFYVFPHVQQFDSWADLLSKLATVDLAEVSRKMAKFNALQKNALLASWRSILDAAKARRLGRQPMPLQYDEAMRALWSDYRPLPPDRPSKLNERCLSLINPSWSSVPRERLPASRPQPRSPDLSTSSLWDPARGCLTEIGKVEAAYCTILGRPADAQGLATYSPTVDDDAKTLWRNLCLSHEYTAKVRGGAPKSPLCQLFCTDRDYARRHPDHCSSLLEQPPPPPPPQKAALASSKNKKAVAACAQENDHILAAAALHDDDVEMCRSLCSYKADFSRANARLCDPFFRVLETPYSSHRPAHLEPAADLWLFVQYLFHSILRRAPDAESREDQQRLLVDDLPLSKLAEKLCVSDEYAALQGVEAPECLALCDEHPSAPLFEHLCRARWQQSPDSRTPATAAYARVVNVLYHLVLGRLPSQPEIDIITRGLRAGEMALGTLVARLCLSGEHKLRVEAGTAPAFHCRPLCVRPAVLGDAAHPIAGAHPEDTTTPKTPWFCQQS